MAGERNYLRVPPDSSGKRIRLVHSAQILYSGKSSTTESLNYIWSVGEFYPIDGFGLVHIHGAQQLTTDSGVLEVHFPKTQQYNNALPTVGATIRSDDGDGLAIAQVTEVREVYINAQNIIGYGNPEYGLNINKFGSAQITFEEGPPELTAFGKLRVNDARLLAYYDFSRDKQVTQFVNSTEGESVSAEWDAGSKSVKLAIGTASGNRSTHTSNLFHSAILGSGIFYSIAARVGDAGKDNCVRSWGAFDAFDGVLFQLSGTVLNVVHRRTMNGSTMNMVIPQSDWNRDTLLGDSGGSNSSGIRLDVTKINLYWMDYQHLGGGRTRWGVYIDGQRITVHEMYSSNDTGDLHNMLGNPNRPICWAIQNTGVVASSSEFYAYGAAVYSEGAADPLESVTSYSSNEEIKMWGTPQNATFWKTGQSRNGSTSINTTLANSYSSDTATQYAFSLSPIQFYRDSSGVLSTVENHSIYQPLSLSASVFNISDNAEKAAEVRIFAKCIMRGTVWESDRDHPTVDIDVHGDHLGHGPEIGRFVVKGTGQFDFSQIFKSYQFGSVKNLSDQPFGRISQKLTAFNSNNDKYSSGRQVIKLTVGTHPIYGSTVHLFEDKQPVIFRTTAGGSDITGIVSANSLNTTEPTGYASFDRQTNPNGWYYLALVDTNEAWLYSSQADIDDDRTIRILNVDNVDNVAIGDLITINSTLTARVAQVETGKIYIVNRAPGLTEALTTGTWTTPSGSGTFTTITLHTGWQKDYYTSLKALTESDVGIGTINLSNPTDIGIVLYGNNPPRQAWTIMIRWLNSATADADGDFGPPMTNANVKFNLFWRERNQ